MMGFNPDSTALVVVDMQNGFCHPDGSLYAPMSGDVIGSVADAVSYADDSGWSLVFTRDVHPPDQFEDNAYYDEFERWGEHVVEGSWEAEIVDELPVEWADLVVDKHTYDAFYQTELEGWLDAHGVDTVVFCGTLANVCVLHSARSAALRDYRTVILEDAVGAIEEDDREFALDHAEWLFGEVASLSELEG